MKKCPFCKAEIDENARYCVYCMTSFEEKETITLPKEKKRWWIPAVAAVLLVLLAVFLLIPKGQKNAGGEETSGVVQTTDAEATESMHEDTQPSQKQEEVPDTHGSQQTSGTQGQKDMTPEPSQSQEPATSAPTSAPAEDEPTPAPTPEQEVTEPTPTPTPTQKENEPAPAPTPEPEVTEPEETEPEETEPEETEPESTPVGAVYAYREARAGDDFNANYANTGNDIVITGIAVPSPNGVYDIPQTIDGKRVIAIVANAFSGSNASTVFVPATVKTIWNYAFAGCPLTDIYFRGSAIYVESKAFSGGLTIHCSASCSDRNFNYYKNCAATYGAVWVEWNG